MPGFEKGVVYVHVGNEMDSARCIAGSNRQDWQLCWQRGHGCASRELRADLRLQILNELIQRNGQVTVLVWLQNRRLFRRYGESFSMSLCFGILAMLLRLFLETGWASGQQVRAFATQAVTGMIPHKTCFCSE